MYVVHAFALLSDNTFLELKAIWRHLSFGSGALALLCWKSLNKVWIWTGYWRAVICPSKGNIGSGWFRARVMDLDRPKPSLAAGARMCEETDMGKLRSKKWIEVLHGVGVLRIQKRWWRRKVESLFLVTGQGERWFRQSACVVSLRCVSCRGSHVAVLRLLQASVLGGAQRFLQPLANIRWLQRFEKTPASRANTPFSQCPTPYIILS